MTMAFISKRFRHVAKNLLAIVFTLAVYLIFVNRASALTDFPIGYSSRGGPSAFVSLMEQERLLEEQGIKTTIVYIGGPEISQALVAGDIQMAILGPVTPLRAAARGAEVRFVGGVTEHEGASLVGDSKITSIAGLKGTRLAIDRLGDTSDFRARKVLEAIGIQPQKDVFLLQIGGQGARFAALKSGQVQSMIVDPPLTLVARKAGFRELVKLSQLAFPSATASIVVMKATGDRRGQEVYGALRAITKALRIYKTDKETAVRALSVFMRLQDREALEETWRVVGEVYKDIPTPSLAGIIVVRDFLGQTEPDVAKLDVEKLIDSRFTDRLKREQGK
jgi:NitT/TauT family transport system substrate-binding protein